MKPSFTEMVGTLPSKHGGQAQLDALLRTDFLAFAQKVFATLNGGQHWSDNWHLEAIAHRLEPFGKRQGARLLVAMPPRSLKSILISVAFPAWRLGQDPSLKIVCASYSSELALKHARDFRRITKSDWYRRVFPQVKLEREAEHDLTTTQGGGRLSTSVGGTLTGLGGHLIIIDDPMKPGEASSEAARKAVIEWYSSTLVTRSDDKRTSDILLVMQRIHEEDLFGHLEEADWPVFKLAAVAQEDEVIPLGGGRFWRRLAGQALHEAREPLHVLEQLRRDMGSALFSAQYLQEPVPAEGNILKRGWLRGYPGDFRLRPGDVVFQSWDCASKEGVANDYSVCITAVLRGNRVFISDVLREKLDFPSLRRRAEFVALRDRPEAILVEDAAAGTQLIQSLRHDSPAGVPSPTRVRPEGDKVSRMGAVAVWAERGDLLIPEEAPWLGTFLKEVLAFPQGRHDDQADALSQLIGWLNRRRDSFGGGGGGAFEIRATDQPGAWMREWLGEDFVDHPDALAREAEEEAFWDVFGSATDFGPDEDGWGKPTDQLSNNGF